MTSALADKHWYQDYADYYIDRRPHVDPERAGYPTELPKRRASGWWRGGHISRVINLVRFDTWPSSVPRELTEKHVDASDWSRIPLYTRQLISGSL